MAKKNEVNGTIVVSCMNNVVEQENRLFFGGKLPDVTVLVDRGNTVKLCDDKDIITQGKSAIRSHSLKIGLAFIAKNAEKPEKISEKILSELVKLAEIERIPAKIDLDHHWEIVDKLAKSGINNLIKKQRIDLAVLEKESNESKTKSAAKKSEKTEKITEKLRAFKLTDAQIAEVLAIVNGKVKKA